MKPAEKAKELILKFSVFKIGNVFCYLTDIEAKQCALICIEEILNLEYADLLVDNVDTGYWCDVRNEINKI